MKNFTLRIDESTLLELGKIAEKEHRSINSQLILIIEKFIEENKDKIEKSKSWKGVINEKGKNVFKK